MVAESIGSQETAVKCDGYCNIPLQFVEAPEQNALPMPYSLSVYGSESLYSQDLCKTEPGATLTYKGTDGTIEERDKTFGAGMGIPGPCCEGVEPSSHCRPPSSLAANCEQAILIAWRLTEPPEEVRPPARVGGDGGAAVGAGARARQPVGPAGKRLTGSQETVACDLGLSFAIRLTAPFEEKACLE
ncbi:hypothetical protein LEMLEM_LOCUS23192 [Lemmus lemmus]